MSLSNKINTNTWQQASLSQKSRDLSHSCWLCICICTETSQGNTWPCCDFDCSIIYSMSSLLCSLPDLQRLCDKWLDVLETFWTDHQPGCSVSCRVAFAAVRGTSCHPLHRLTELHFKAIFLLSWSLLGGSLRALFPHQCLEETFQSTCQIHAWLFFWLNYFYSEKLHFHNTDRECALLRNPYPVSAVTVIEHSFPLTDPHLPAP